jgi:hypothetical protein
VVTKEIANAAEFADVLLGLFEDIPGFETISQSRANRIVNQLWRKCRVQNS